MGRGGLDGRGAAGAFAGFEQGLAGNSRPGRGRYTPGLKGVKLETSPEHTGLTQEEKMSKLSTTCALIFIPAIGFAMGEANAEIDTNADGFYSIEEMQAAFPDLSDEMFIGIDTNADGLLDVAEVKAAQDAELLPVTDG